MDKLCNEVQTLLQAFQHAQASPLVVSTSACQLSGFVRSQMPESLLVKIYAWN
jgi:hypothetical protein